MIPLRDNIPSSKFPAVTLSIIVINVLVFLYELRLGPHLEDLLGSFAVIPAVYTNPDVGHFYTASQKLFAFFSSMFLHGSWLHLLGNMWTLWIFGDNVEDRMGPVRFIAFYILCGLAAGLVHWFTNLDSPIPTVGASGAIAGVMGAYLFLFPRARMIVLVLIVFIPLFFEL